MSEIGKTIIRVAPDIYAEQPLPQVILSDPEGEGAAQIEWQMVKGCGEYVFAELIRDSDAFSNVEGIDTDTMTCDFDTAAPGKHRYDIEIRSGNNHYRTQPRGGGPDPGKPVIRN